jgi:hypothetical protein
LILDFQWYDEYIVMSHFKIQNQKSKILLTVFSRIFDPFVVLPAVVIYSIFRSNLQSGPQLEFLVIVLGVMVIPPVLILYWAIRTKRIKNWDISDRSQRPEALITLFFLGLVNILIVRQFGDRNLVNLFILFELWLAGFMTITFLWKISGHASIAALAAGILLIMNGYSWWPVLLIVPFISVVRVLRHDHTPAQVTVGALYSFILIYFWNQIWLMN